MKGEVIRSRYQGLGDAVAAIATPIASALHMPCVDPATGQLRPESKCAKRKDVLNSLVRFDRERKDLAYDFYAHGGLGDVFLDLFESGHYQQLETLVPGAKARVIFFSSNPSRLNSSRGIRTATESKPFPASNGAAATTTPIAPVSLASQFQK